MLRKLIIYRYVLSKQTTPFLKDPLIIKYCISQNLVSLLIVTKSIYTNYNIEQPFRYGFQRATCAVEPMKTLV